MLCISAAYAVMRCMCVSRSCIVSKRIKISSVFSPSDSHAILVFPHQTGWQYSVPYPMHLHSTPPLGRRMQVHGVGYSHEINDYLALQSITAAPYVVCISHSAAGFLFTAGIERPIKNRDRRAAVYRARPTKRGLSLYTVTVDVNRVYDSKARRYAEDNRTESNCK